MNESSAPLIHALERLRQEMDAPGQGDLPTILAASDLHGNASRLANLLERSDEHQAHHVFLVGDIYSGPRGWDMYCMLKPLVHESEPMTGRVVPMWGNHELAFVTGMLGSDRQLRFFYGFGGRELIANMNEQAQRDGLEPLALSGQASPSPDDLAAIRNHAPLQEMRSWIQATHRVLVHDFYGTGYMHASPKINRQGRVDVQYDGQLGVDAIRGIERDLKNAERWDDPVFSPLLQTQTSPLWGLFEVGNPQRFDHAYQSWGVRQLVFGHRHLPDALNVNGLNRQIGIGVQFDQGLGGYLIVDANGMTFHRYTDPASQATEAHQLLVPSGGLTVRETFLLDSGEFLFEKLIDAERDYFDSLPRGSANYRREFESLEGTRKKGTSRIPRLYAELYPHVKDNELRNAMFLAAVESSDEEAFQSFIHLLHHSISKIESLGTDWFSEPYREAKSIVEVLLTALREMPVRRLGLFDVKLRGTTTRINLLQLYTKILSLLDPDLAVLAIENLGALDHWEADQELRKAFFHDVRKVRVRAAEALAQRGEVTYPLVASLMTYPDNWVRFLAYWTVGKLGKQAGAIRSQAVLDIRRNLTREQDWLIRATGRELLRKLGAREDESFEPSTRIPNLTESIMEILQQIVDSQHEPFRTSFHVYFITVRLSSLVYRRGLIGLDIDELKIYVSNKDFFPHQFRYYKSGDRDYQGNWQGWRRLWIRGETFNWPDGPEIIELPKQEPHETPTGAETIVLYDAQSQDTVTLPPLDEIIDQYGLGKLKDRIRHVLLQRWDSFSVEEREMISRIHASAVVKMLFDLPAEIYVDAKESAILERLSEAQVDAQAPELRTFLTLRPTSQRAAEAQLNWIDAQKYAVRVVQTDPTA